MLCWCALLSVRNVTSTEFWAPAPLLPMANSMPMEEIWVSFLPTHSTFYSEMILLQDNIFALHPTLSFLNQRAYAIREKTSFYLLVPHSEFAISHLSPEPPNSVQLSSKVPAILPLLK